MNFLRQFRSIFTFLGLIFALQSSASPLLALRAASLAKSAFMSAQRACASLRSYSTLQSSGHLAARPVANVLQTGQKAGRIPSMASRTLFTPKNTLVPATRWSRVRAALSRWKKTIALTAVTGTAAGGFVAGAYWYRGYENKQKNLAIALVNGGVSGDHMVVSTNSFQVALKVLNHLGKPLTYNIAEQLHTLTPAEQTKAFDYIIEMLLTKNDHSTMKELYDVICLLPVPHAQFPEFLAAVKANTGLCRRDAMSDALTGLLAREKVNFSGPPLLPKKITDWVSNVGYTRIIAAKARGETLDEMKILYAKLPCPTSIRQYTLPASQEPVQPAKPVVPEQPAQ